MGGIKTLTEELWMNVPKRRAIVSIHRDVERLVADSGVRDGSCLKNVTVRSERGIFASLKGGGLCVY